MNHSASFQRRYTRKRGLPRLAQNCIALAFLAGFVAIRLFGTELLEQTSVFDSRGEVVNATFDFCTMGYQPDCVIDGDTIRYNGDRIRVEDIDAPETHDPQCDSEYALGERATRRLHELMNEGPFELAQRGSRNTDIYGRQLRVLKRDGRSLGAILVNEGLARHWDGARHPWCT